jgi:hypothetical protein
VGVLVANWAALKGNKEGLSSWGEGQPGSHWRVVVNNHVGKGGRRQANTLPVIVSAAANRTLKGIACAILPPAAADKGSRQC